MADGGSNTVPGAVITGPARSSAQTGFSVAAGGDFNADGFGDILVGSPGFAGSSTTLGQGEVTLLYGASSTSGGYLTGAIPLAAIPGEHRRRTDPGANAGDAAGYAISQVGVINAGQPTGILIGAPGYNSDTGTAYLIPGRAKFHRDVFTFYNIHQVRPRP